jgi:polyhydroxybutyrate depolymerase
MRAVADARGWIVLYPDGTPSILRRIRTWNAGGGEDGWQCVSGRGCRRDVDDAAYVDAVLATIGAAVPIDTSRIYATGLSNGGAMAHRMACERADTFAGIAAVGAGNQWAAWPGCVPSRPVAVLSIHGTEDTCWSYDGGAAACAQDDGGAKVSVEQTMVGDDRVEGWAERLGCSGVSTDMDLPDTADDGMTTVQRDWTECAAPLRLLSVQGGGHTWPGGDPYLAVAGAATRDFVATEAILDFFEGR